MRILVTTLADLKRINPQRPHQLIYYLSKYHEVTIFSVNAWWLKPVNDEFIDISLKNTDFHYFSNKRIHPILQEFNFPVILKKINKKNDSFDVHVNFHGLISCFLAQRMLKIPTVIDICDDLIEWISHSPKIPILIRPLAKSFSKIILAQNLKNAKAISFSVKSLHDQYNFVGKKSTIIPNGVNIQHFVPLNVQKTHLLNIGEDMFTLGFVGYLGEWIDLTPVFQAMEKLKKMFPLKLIIIGNGPMMDSIKRLSEKYHLCDDIIITGNLPQNDIPKYIACMDTCLIPFDNSPISQNALPLKVFEYLACGKPVLTTRLKNVEDIMGNRIFYFSDANELMDQLILIHESSNGNKKIEFQNRDFIINNYSWESIGRNFEQILINAQKQG